MLKSVGFVVVESQSVLLLSVVLSYVDCGDDGVLDNMVISGEDVFLVRCLTLCLVCLVLCGLSCYYICF